MKFRFTLCGSIDIEAENQEKARDIVWDFIGSISSPDYDPVKSVDLETDSFEKLKEEEDGDTLHAATGSTE